VVLLLPEGRLLLPEAQCGTKHKIHIASKRNGSMAWEEEFDMSSDEEYVPAVFARSLDEAEEFRQLLEDHGIEAILGDEEEDATVAADPDTTVDAITHGVAVLVPEMYLDEASEIIADREDGDEFEDDDELEDDEEEDEFPIGDEDEDGYFQIEEEEDEEDGIYEEDEEEDEFLDEEEEDEL
jgi:hypothetical protein